MGIRGMVYHTAAVTVCPGACHQQTGLKAVPVWQLCAHHFDSLEI